MKEKCERYMEEQLISVILPTYNRADTIQNTVENILEQTYPNIEVIIVDDASCDNTKEIIDAIADERLIYIRNTENMGANASRNKGILRAKGEYISFMDSADKWDKHKLEQQVRFLSEHEDSVDVVFCSEIVMDMRNSYKIPGRNKREMISKGKLKEILAAENCIDTPTIFCKKSCFSFVGLLNEELPRLQEYEWLIRAVQKCNIAYMDECLVEAVIRPDSISVDVEKLMRSVIMIYNIHFDFFERYAIAPETLLLLPIKQLYVEKADYSSYEKYFMFLHQYLNLELQHYISHVYQWAVKCMYYEVEILKCETKNITDKCTLRELIQDRKKFNIFGAGMILDQLWDYLTDNNAEELVGAIIVTSCEENRSFKYNNMLIEPENCDDYQKSTPIVLSVSETNMTDVMELLRMNNFTNIVILTENDRVLIKERSL